MDNPFLHLLLLCPFVQFTLAATRDHSHTLLHVSPLPERQDPQQEAPQYDAGGGSLEWSQSAYDEVNGASLTLKLVHRDSPFSPLRDPHANAQELLEQRLTRDTTRADALSARASRSRKHAGEAVTLDQDNQVTAPLVSGWKEGVAEYFIRVGVGTPPIENYMVIDTGSDVIWLQCEPCRVCYEQKYPVFDPALSSSYTKLPCSSPMCSMLDSHTCAAAAISSGAGNDNEEEYCVYEAEYGDGSFTEGEFAIETVSFNGATMEGIALGCGHQNEGLFAVAAGIFGLGAGALSFPSQMGAQISKIFSYCLMGKDEDTSSGSLIFGQAALPLGAQFTPLLARPTFESTFYYVSLVGISVGTRMLTIPQRAFKMDVSGNGGVIVDSGTSVTWLVAVAYRPLRSAFRAAMRNVPFVGGYSILDTCYDLSGSIDVKVPSLSLHFEGGGEMVLPSSNYVIPVDDQGTYCLAFTSTQEDLSIIGNIQQQGFRMVFDLVSSRLGFAPEQC